MRTFAGDGERTPTGAAEGQAPSAADGAGDIVPDDAEKPGPSGTNPFLKVRTRKSLADLINSTEGLVEVKVEEQEEMECGGEESEVILMERDFSDESYDEEGMEDVDERILQSDYDEREYEEVVSYVGEGEGEAEQEGGEYTLQAENDGREEVEAGGPGEEGEEGQAGEDQQREGGNGEETEQEGTGNPGPGEEGQAGADPKEEAGGEVKEDDRKKDTRGRGKRIEEEKGKRQPKEADLIVDEQEAARPSFQPDGMYYAVKQVLKGAVNGFPLNKRFKDESIPDPGFMQPGDERWGRNRNHLSDQHFPANVPADGPGECLRVIRVENGTLNELTDELIRKAPSKGLPAGSVILLLSTSQLYYESVEYYAAEWSRCRNWLRGDLGEVLVLPGLPLTGSGIHSETAVRGLLDFYAWIGRLEEPELNLIRNTRLAWADVYLGKTERGGDGRILELTSDCLSPSRKGQVPRPPLGGGGGRGQRQSLP